MSSWTPSSGRLPVDHEAWLNFWHFRYLQIVIHVGLLGGWLEVVPFRLLNCVRLERWGNRFAVTEWGETHALSLHANGALIIANCVLDLVSVVLPMLVTERLCRQYLLLPALNTFTRESFRLSFTSVVPLSDASLSLSCSDSRIYWVERRSILA